jgi:hypothetical protein
MTDYVYSDTYTGPRYTYGLRYRPMQIGAQPKGFIIGSVVPGPLGRHTFGTVQYPFELTPEQCRSYEIERVITAGETTDKGAR